MTPSDTPKFVSKSAMKYFSGTLLSRVTGVTRDMVMAFFFGASPPLAAFFLAYRFVYLIRRLFGESLLHQGFIPHFEQTKAVDPKAAALFFRDLFWTMAVGVIALIVVGELGLSFFDNRTSTLAKMMLPGVLFLCLFGLTSGLLHSEKSFFLPSVAPGAFNLVWIAGVIGMAHFPASKAMKGLALTLSGAFFFQWIVTLPKTWRFLRRELSAGEIFHGHLFSDELKKLIQPLLLGVIGVAAVQVNSLVDGIFSRFASPEGPAYLWYAIRMQQLPLALFGIAFSSALLPSLSRARDEAHYSELLSFAKKRIFLFVFPCVIGIFVLGASSVNVLFGRGDFSQHTTESTTLCLWGYGLGLLPMAMTQILAPAFYAKKDYKTPAMAFLFSSALNIALNAFFVFTLKWGPAAIAIGTSAAGFFNYFYLSQKLGHSTPIAWRVVASGIISGMAILLFGYFVLQDPTLPMLFGKAVFSRALPVQIFQFGLQTALFFSVFFTLLLGRPSGSRLRRVLKDRHF